MKKIVFIRHGESIWNMKNLFTGWTDVDLSDKGIAEAKQAGTILKQNDFSFDIAYTSLLKRAIKTLHNVLEIMDLLWVPEYKTWVLNERHYGALQGLNKAETAEKFGDAQYHIEWMAPAKICGSSQWRGNSGILLMNHYEIQVLDSYDNPTYADGGAAAIYGQWPPLVNASRKPGEWQTYDIVFEAPLFEGEKLAKPAFVTVIHNGVLVHHHKEIIGRMAHRIVGTYAPHDPEQPLGLQDHDTSVRYRNIWVRRLAGYDRK